MCVYINKETGEVKIADFGVSANGSKRRTIVGSPYWMVMWYLGFIFIE